jgi:uncharacterized protein YkwD
MRKYKIIFFSFLFIFLFVLKVNADTYEKKFNVELDKVWEITFSEEIEESTAIESIKILSFEGEIKTSVKVENDKVYIEPVGNLLNSHEYKLVIEKGIESTKGNKLKENNIVPFVTVSEPGGKDISYTDTFTNEYNFTWKLSHNGYEQFVLDGEYLGKIVAGFSTESGYEKNGIKVSNNKFDVINLLGEGLSYIEKDNVRYDLDSDGESSTYLLDNEYVTYFYDKHDSNKVRSIHWVTKDVENMKKGFYGIPNEDLKVGFEDLMVDLINDTRKDFGLNILKYDKTVNEVARTHSRDMVDNNYFNHVNLKGESPADRMEKADYKMSIVGENLAYGQFSSIFAHEGLMNSIKHRENILNGQYERVGVGVHFSNDGTPYFTINFYSPR